MSIFSRLFGEMFSSDPAIDCPSINPASGLPMVNCSIDTEGNLYGTNFHDQQQMESNALDISMTDDSYSNSFTSSSDDSWSMSDNFSSSWDD